MRSTVILVLLCPLAATAAVEDFLYKIDIFAEGGVAADGTRGGAGRMPVLVDWRQHVSAWWLEWIWAAR